MQLVSQLQKAELDSTYREDCGNDSISFFINLPRNAFLDQPITILIILSSVPLGRSFAGSPIHLYHR